MDMPQEFHYRLARRAGGWRPGSHRGSSVGAGLEFVSHASLADRPDPRRIDLRASLRDPHHDWLVREHRQRVGVPVHALVDVSASMRFGTPRTKLERVGDFLRALGLSAYRVGDALGLAAFDRQARDELYAPARHGRGIGELMAELLVASCGGPGGIEGLEDAARRVGGHRGLVFVVSDFHWELRRLPEVLDLLAPADVVPLVVWDRGEVEPPARDGIARLEDMESGRHRTLWVRASVRTAWRDAVEVRRAALMDLLAVRGLRPFFMEGDFHADAMSTYFLEATAR